MRHEGKGEQDRRDCRQPSSRRAKAEQAEGHDREDANRRHETGRVGVDDRETQPGGRNAKPQRRQSVGSPMRKPERHNRKRQPHVGQHAKSVRNELLQGGGERTMSAPNLQYPTPKEPRYWELEVGSWKLGVWPLGPGCSDHPVACGPLAACASWRMAPR